MGKILKKGDRVNGHLLLDIEGKTILFKCGRCGATSTKNRSNLYHNTGCSNCAKANQKLGFSLRTKCWILGLYLPTIKSRIQRGWSVTEALYQDKRVFKESFNEKDLKYINKFYTEHYDEDERIADRAYLKSKITKLGTG